MNDENLKSTQANEVIETQDDVQLSFQEEESERPQNIFRRHIVENPKKRLLARHRMWLDSLQHEYPLPFVPYKVGVYIRYHNQTKHPDYLQKHIDQFTDDIALCPNWTLVGFYIDKGAKAPKMENAPELCRLLDDCFAGKVDLIVTQKVSNVSSDPEEMAFLARILAAQKKPVGIYFISEDIYTLASYYTQDLYRGNLLPEGWEPLPEDELDRELLGNNLGTLMIEDHSGETEESFAITHKGE